MDLKDIAMMKVIWPVGAGGGESGGGEGFVFDTTSSGFVGVYGFATTPALTFPDTMFTSSATGELTS